MPILTTNLPLTIVPGMSEYNKIFWDTLEGQEAPSFDPIFAITTTDKLTDVEVAMTDLARIPQRAGPSAPMQELSMDEQFKVQVDVVEYAARFSVPKIHWKALPGDLRARYPQAFANSAKETMEFHAWSLIAGTFTNAGPDGVNVCAVNHPSPAGNWSNTSTVAFSAAALSQTVAAMSRIPSPQGRIVTGHQPRYIVAPPELDKVIFETLNASSVEANVRAANIASTYGLTKVGSAHLPDSTDWWLTVDPMRLPHVRMVVQTSPEFDSGYDRREADYWGNVDFAFGQGFYTPRGIYGQQAP